MSSCCSSSLLELGLSVQKGEIFDTWVWSWSWGGAHAVEEYQAGAPVIEVLQPSSFCACALLICPCFVGCSESWEGLSIFVGFRVLELTICYLDTKLKPAFRGLVFITERQDAIVQLQLHSECMGLCLLPCWQGCALPEWLSFTNTDRLHLIGLF